MPSLNVIQKTGAITVVQQIAASTTASTPGYSTTRNPAYVHAVAFGDLFESNSTSPLTTPALQFLTAVQIYGNTSTLPSGSDYSRHDGRVVHEFAQYRDLLQQPRTMEDCHGRLHDAHREYWLVHATHHAGRHPGGIDSVGSEFSFQRSVSKGTENRTLNTEN